MTTMTINEAPTFDLHTCDCVKRHIDEAVHLFDHSEKLLQEGLALPEELTCDTLRLVKSAAELRLAGIREVRAAQTVMHFYPCVASTR